MNQANSPSWLLSAAVFAFGFIATPISAQITPDGTLPNNSVVLPNGNIITIEGGTEAGTNLFHSFEEFSIPTRSEAFFNNATSIDNIITRVTGGNLSDIDGLIRANGTANLFLMNPAGILFGENASLNIGGSFFATTAESLVFGDGIEFSTRASSETSLLTINIPIGLQMGSNPGNIIVRGNGHRLTGGVIIPVTRGETPQGLQVNSGNTLALIGGDIRLDGGILTAEGNIELGAVGSNDISDRVEIVPAAAGWNVNYDNINQFRDIQLSQQAFIDASESIQLQGRNITLTENSNVLLESQGFSEFSVLEVRSSESIEIVGGINTEGFIATSFYSQSFFGNGGNIELSTPSLMISNGGKITNVAFGTANGGHVSIDVAEAIDLSGFQPNNPFNVSTINTLNLGSGRGGDLIVSSDRFNLTDGSNITSVIYDSGNGGDVTVRARQIELNGINPIFFIPSTIGSTNFGEGNLGNVKIDTSNLVLQDGARVTAGTFSVGNSGRLTINASEFIEIDGREISGSPTQIRSSAQIADRTAQELFGVPPIPTGEAGDIEIDTPQLIVTDGATVTLENEGLGNAGSLIVNSDAIVLDNEGSITAAILSGVGGNIRLHSENSLQLNNSSTITTEAEGMGDGGNITIDVPNLQLRNNSRISAEAGRTGNGGNLNLDTETIALLENSSIDANAFEGSGGNIQITTSGLFVSGNSGITASSQFGVDGIVTINNPIVDPASGLVALDGDTLDPNTQVSNSCEIATRSRFAFAGSGGLPEDPTQSLPVRTVWRDTRLGEIDTHLTPNPTETEISESAAPPAPLVEATGWRRNDRGQIELIVASGNPSQSPWKPHPECNLLSQESDGVESSAR